MEQQVTVKDITKHYLSSLLIYGILLIFIAFCPAYLETVGDEKFDYIAFFTIYYMLYLIIAPIIFYTVKPKTILQSKSFSVINYFVRQFKRNLSLDERLKNIEPNEFEKLSLMTFFIKTFFGVYCVILLCEKYLPSLGYSIEYIITMIKEAIRFILSTGEFAGGISQYILDSSDMWLKIILTISTSVYTFSYLTEFSFLKNRIKSTDTSPLGVFSCVICYYPVILLTDKFIDIKQHSMLSIDNNFLSVVVNLLVVLVNLFSLIAILRLGTRVSNLTNRGIETKFPYNIVRHPEYSMQIFYVILTTIPIYFMYEDFFEKLYLTIGTFAWIFIYILRAITEERHLIKDENYKIYSEKVQYRFIPKVF